MGHPNDETMQSQASICILTRRLNLEDTSRSHATPPTRVVSLLEVGGLDLVLGVRRPGGAAGVPGHAGGRRLVKLGDELPSLVGRAVRHALQSVVLVGVRNQVGVLL